MFMPPYYHHPNAGPWHGRPRCPSPPMPNHHRCAPQPNNYRHCPGHPTDNRNRGNNFSSGGRHNSNNLLPPSRHAPFSNFGFGPDRPHHAVGGNAPIHRGNDYGSTMLPLMNQANDSEFNNNLHSNRWNAALRQQQHFPPGRFANQNPALPVPPQLNNPHINARSNANPNIGLRDHPRHEPHDHNLWHGQQKRQHHLTFAAPAMRPPPLHEYSRNNKRTRRDTRGRDACTAPREASEEKREASRNDPPKPAKAPDERRHASMVSRHSSSSTWTRSRDSIVSSDDRASGEKSGASRNDPPKPAKKWDEMPWKPHVPSPPVPNKPIIGQPSCKKPTTWPASRAANSAKKAETSAAKNNEPTMMHNEDKAEEMLRRKLLAKKNNKNGIKGGSSSQSFLGGNTEKRRNRLDVEIKLPKKSKLEGEEFDLASNQKDAVDLLSNVSHPKKLSQVGKVSLRMVTPPQLSRSVANGQATKIQEYDSKDDDEMDISDDEEAPQRIWVDLKEEDVLDPNGAASDSMSCPKVGEATVAQQPSKKHDPELIEKEKHALRLAELKAKAKLAKSKLRNAEQKKIRKDSSQNRFTIPQNNACITPMFYRPVSTSPLPLNLPDITIGSLIIEDAALTGPPEEVWFVDSVYSLTKASPSVPIPQSEENRKKSESLKQKLQLARQKLEVKKKELNKKKSLSSATEESTSEQKKEGHVLELEFDPAVTYADKEQRSEDPIQGKPEQLRHSQLNQENEVIDLHNVIDRQQELLRAQGQELAESSNQLQSCVVSVREKQALLEESERRLEEIHYQKRIVERMVFRATEQLVAARKALSER